MRREPGDVERPDAARPVENGAERRRFRERMAAARPARGRTRRNQANVSAQMFCAQLNA
jgi:hypothetical protein